jgi:Protein of unknown function (DUF3489)
MVPALQQGNHPMTKLSDTQSIILSAAAQRPDGNVLPLPGSLRGGAAGKVVNAMLSRGLVREQVTEAVTKADTALTTIWRNEADGRVVLLRITPAGLKAIGVEPAGRQDDGVATGADASPAGQIAAGTPTGAAGAPTGLETDQDAAETKAAPAARTAAPARKSRAGSKQALVVEMLTRPEGATIAQIVEATGWQPHTVRGAFAGALKKRLGLSVTSEKVEGRGRVYRVRGGLGVRAS